MGHPDRPSFAKCSLVLPASQTPTYIQPTTSGAKITETMLISLIRMLRLGPAVSLNGSPTVSPMLLRRWAQSKEGRGQVVLISAEVGLGKSALVDVLRAQVRNEGLSCIAFYCSPYHTNSAFYPIIDYVQWSLKWQPDDTAATKLAKLEQRLQGTSLARENAVPLLAALLSLSVEWPL